MYTQMVGRRAAFPEYVDWLAELRQQGGFNFVTQSRDFPMNSTFTNHPKARTYDEIAESVLNSPRVKEAILHQARKTGQSIEKVRCDAEATLKVMAHNWGLQSTRIFGYSVAKVLERIFDAIYVNSGQVKRIRELCKSDPVVFMPSHRTYLDFLLLSLFCFEYEVPLPAIAAGMDFMNSWFMSEVLRRSGAFFIRRSIGEDRLYWAILSEYVETHIVHSDRPVEFFVEATRSRVGKSLHPKYGLLQIVLEPYLRGKVYDIVSYGKLEITVKKTKRALTCPSLFQKVVPVTMNYDKLLEEMLYSYELLGFPKPKESTSGLIKARQFLNKRFGRCFVTFGEPISVRDYFGMSLHRSQFVCQSVSQPDSQFFLTGDQRKQIKKFAHVVVGNLDQNAVITLWSLACVAMAQCLSNDDSTVFTYAYVHSEVVKLLRLLEALDVTVNIAVSINEDLRYYLNLHSELFEPVDMTATNFHLKLVDFPVEREGNVARKLMERSVSRLILATYSNTMMHSICDVGFIAAIILGRNADSISTIEEHYR
ncbi:Acyltransferase [Ancylostoma caninum]|uniref:Acyltransferase n=1 Tax=Ancylostoma caninum TaxID=29170 RepID=A0A368G551_ANCCA|nr:Acyltransferase [Ancylostoma caninum]